MVFEMGMIPSVNFITPPTTPSFQKETSHLTGLELSFSYAHQCLNDREGRGGGGGGVEVLRWRPDNIAKKGEATFYPN
jgi:hypothetical protein